MKATHDELHWILTRYGIHVHDIIEEYGLNLPTGTPGILSRHFKPCFDACDRVLTNRKLKEYEG